MNEALDIIITDEDIDEVEKVFGNVHFDKFRRDIIKDLSSFDVQAFPGTGKTTVLVAKLAILAMKWPHNYRGICVLSHTNAARDEIESRLGHTDIGKRLLSYPHFVGTIQSFIDNYISIPFLRNKGKGITLIDTEFVTTQRFRQISHASKQYFSHKRLNENNCQVVDFPLEIDVKAGKESQTYIDVHSVIQKSLKAGYYTYNEMQLLARYALNNFPLIVQTINNRFALIVIDEAQDTNDLQEEILNKAFPSEKVVVERFGDINQAIYHSISENNANPSFPENQKYTMIDSLRYGEHISKLAAPLSVCQQEMKGVSTEYTDNHNSIILFSNENVENVVNAFGDILFQSFPDEILERNKNAIFAVGMVHNKDQCDISDPHYPVSVRDYYPSYSPENKKRKNPYELIEYWRNALSADEFSEKIETIAKGIRHLINQNTDSKIHFKKTNFISLCSQIESQSLIEYRKAFYSLIHIQIDSKELWNSQKIRIIEFVNRWFSLDVSRSDVLKWTDNQQKEETQTSNVYSYSSGDGRTVNITFSSIHAQKGRTHFATLVLDTYWKTRNCKSILPWLKGTSKSKHFNSAIDKRLKCHYVALTRAKALVCLAMPKSDIDEKSRDSLKDKGWNIVEL